MGCAPSAPDATVDPGSNRKPTTSGAETERLPPRPQGQQPQFPSSTRWTSPPSTSSSTGVSTTDGGYYDRPQPPFSSLRQYSFSASNLGEAEPVAPPKLDSNGNLMKEEVVRRTSCSIENKTVMLGSTEYPTQMEVS